MKTRTFASWAVKGAMALALAVACLCTVYVAQAHAASYVTNATTTSISLKWDYRGSGYRYNVYVAQAGTGDYRKAATLFGTSATITGLAPNKEYDFNISYQQPEGSSYGAEYLVGAEYYQPTVPTKITSVKLRNSLMFIKKGDLVWSKRASADGYQIQYISAKGKKKTVSTTLGAINSTTIKLDPKQFYKVKVRSYVKMTDGRKVYSAWSPTKYINLQQKLKAKLSSKRNNKVKISWSKVKGAKNYTVYASFKEKSGYKKIKTTKGTSVTFNKIGKKKIKKFKTFYVYMVANKKVGKTTYKTKISYKHSYWVY